jgi:hypothetical protein
MTHRLCALEKKAANSREHCNDANSNRDRGLRHHSFLLSVIIGR